MHEFVSDTLQASSEDLVEVQEGMKKLVLGAKNKGKTDASRFINFYFIGTMAYSWKIKSKIIHYGIVEPMKWKFLALFYVFLV